MSYSYLPEKCFAVCTFQLGTDYGQFLVSRSVITVQQSCKNAWLVETDKKIPDDFDFICKSHRSSGAGTVALGAGVLVGLEVAIAVSTVPIAGWIVGAGIALACLIIAFGAFELSQSPTCSQMIGYQESYWVLVSTTVRFDKQYALTRKLKLVCKEGGVLLPFISETYAKQAAEAIGNNNQKEVLTNIAAGFFSGFLVGYSFGGAATVLGTLKIVGSFAGWSAATMFVFNPFIIDPMTNATSDAIANAEGTSASYDEIEDLADDSFDTNNNFFKEEIEQAEKHPLDSDDFIEQAVHIYKTNKNIKMNEQQKAAFERDINRIKNATGSRNREKRAQLRAQFEKDVKDGKYGEDLKTEMTKPNGRIRGATESNRDRGIDAKNSENRANRAKIGRTGGILGIQLFVFPIISSYFGNEAVRLAAEIYDQDLTDSVSVCAVE